MPTIKHGRRPERVTRLVSQRKRKRVVLPLLKGKGKPGPLCPNLETPYDVVFDER